MTTGSKIRYFFISLIIVFLLPSCEKNKNDVIPYTYVNFTIDLNDFPNLSTFGGSDTVDAYDLRIDNGRIYAGGNDGNGIIIYRDTYEFFAFDRTCPHDYEVNNKSVKVKIDGLFAECPECGTIYALPNNGSPYSGPGKYYLKNYKTSFNERYLTVWSIR